MSDVYSIITDRIIGPLEKGVVPWHKPWYGGERMPRNLVNKKEYRGVNVFLLHAMAYESPYWPTYKQAQELGGDVRKGEHACPVVFWKWLDIEWEEKRVPFLRYYSVFNVSQCEGIEAPAVEGTVHRHNPIETAERIVADFD